MSMRIALFFAGGEAYFLGMVLIAIAACCGHVRHKRVRSLAEVGWIAGFLLILCSATPAPLWLYGSWVAALVAWLLLRARWTAGRPWLRVLGSAAVCLASVIAVGLEWTHRRLPALPPAVLDRLVVIGDSISAGLTHGETTWPRVLAAEHALKVTDLSRAGETVESALQQLGKIPAGPCVVILEIGGNDLLGGTDAREFERHLTRLIERSAGPDRQMVMFELPLPIMGHRFGWIQRRVARQHGVALIPKRVLADVLGSPGNTLDGLHLSNQGHARMAAWVWPVLHAP